MYLLTTQRATAQQRIGQLYDALPPHCERTNRCAASRRRLSSAAARSGLEMERRSADRSHRRPGRSRPAETRNKNLRARVPTTPDARHARRVARGAPSGTRKPEPGRTGKQPRRQPGRLIGDPSRRGARPVLMAVRSSRPQPYPCRIGGSWPPRNPCAGAVPSSPRPRWRTGPRRSCRRACCG